MRLPRPEAPRAHAGRHGAIQDPTNVPRTLARNRAVDETVRSGRWPARWSAAGLSAHLDCLQTSGAQGRGKPAITGVQNFQGRAIFADDSPALYPSIGTSRYLGGPPESFRMPRTPARRRERSTLADDCIGGVWGSMRAERIRDEMGIAAGVAITASTGRAAGAVCPAVGAVRAQAVASKRLGRRVAVSCLGDLGGWGALVAEARRQAH